MTGIVEITGKQIVAFLRYSLFVTGIFVFAGGAAAREYDFMFWGMFVFFISNLFFGFAEGSTRFVFLFFHLAIFTFLISRPFILCIQGQEWVWFGEEATWAALMMVFLSLLSLRIGAVIGDGILKRCDFMEKRSVQREPTEHEKDFRESLAIVSLVIFIVCIAASFAQGVEMIAFMRDRTYNEFFLNYESSLPGAVGHLAGMAKYAMCIFLATMPRKKAAAAVLGIYLLDAVPMFIIGVRNPVVLRVIFILVYFILRDVMHDKEKWIGKFLKTILVIGTPAALAFLSIYSRIRLDKSVNTGLGESIGSFFFSQGVSFDTVRAVYGVIPGLPSQVPKNYTFGPFTDYILHGSIGQKLFGTVDIGTTNSTVKAVYGSNLAHSAMYTMDKGQYLEGWGKGSSYVLENYVDWGYAGVIIFSIILGVVLILLLLMMKKNNTLVRTIAFTAILGLFFAPRAEATEWIAFLVYIQFWALIIIAYLLAGLCVRKYSYKNRSRIRLTIKEENTGV